MMDRPGGKPRPPKPDGVCVKCEHAKQKHNDSCYCVKYGIIIGYGKVSCDGYEDEQVPE